MQLLIMTKQTTLDVLQLEITIAFSVAVVVVVVFQKKELSFFFKFLAREIFL